MKTLFLSLLLLIGSFTAFAQHNFGLEPMKKIDFTTGKPATDSLNIAFETLKVQPDYKLYFSQNKKPKLSTCQATNLSNMPIAEPQNFTWNMPIAVPDSTINYAIQIKRIGAHPTPDK